MEKTNKNIGGIKLKLTESEYRKYMKKFEKKYKLIKQGDDVLEIKCKGSNSISSYDIGRKLLLFSLYDVRTVRTRRFLMKKLEELKNVWYEISQDGDSEMTIIFKEEDLDKFADVFKMRKKRQISPEERIILMKRLEKAREKQDSQNKQMEVQNDR